jgi:hypothetical protein
MIFGIDQPSSIAARYGYSLFPAADIFRHVREYCRINAGLCARSNGLRVPLARRETAGGLRRQHLAWGRHQAGAHSPWLGQFDLGQCAWAIFIIHIPRCRREEGQMPASYNHPWWMFKAWKGWKGVCSSFADSDVCSEHELKRRADYLGIPAAQLRWVSSCGPDPISLLERRMEALSLDPDKVAHIEPLTIRELRQRCVKCAKLGQCALDLADEFADPGFQSWRGYCPNAATLTMLGTFESYSKAYNEPLENL